ncbi:MAG: tetratricopeptide repeat protein [Aggregatilineales bacterium]
MNHASNLAARLMQTRFAKSALPTAIFGSVDTLSQALEIDRPPVRIGVWPIVSQKTPHTAMGIATLLAFLLERHEKTRVYRLFARIDGEPESYRWSIKDSQFDVDDWQLDDLDENAAVWGVLEQLEGSWQLELRVENDMAAEGEDTRVFTVIGAQLVDLVEALPQTTTEIANYLGAGETSLMSPLFTLPSEWKSADDLERLLHRLFTCELSLFLALWGKPWSLNQIVRDIQELMDAGTDLGSLGEWAVASALARIIGRAPALDETNIAEIVHTVVGYFSSFAAGYVIVAGSLYRSGYTQECFSVLDEAVERFGDSTLPRIALGEYLRSSGRLFDALDVFQEALEDDVADADLYIRYANLLSVLDYSGAVVEDFVLIDMTQRAPNLLALEALAAYTAALELEPNNAQALSGQLLQLLDIGSVGEQFWNGFSHLVGIDSSGELVRGLLDAMDDVENVWPGVRILASALDKHPDRSDVAVNLAVAYILQGERASAMRALDHARALTTDPLILADVERLALSAQDPDFESRIGDILDLISAGAKVDADDAEYLESVIARAPTFSEPYVLLAKAYLGWEEVGSAIDTLLDGYKRIPGDPELTFLLAQTLWNSGEHELAVSYLSKGIVSNPNYVPLLALMGRYLFDSDRFEEARVYLMRAELISPRDPTLQAVRAYIASKLGE